jgi:hypothetical protein
MGNTWKVIWRDKKLRKRLTRFKDVKDAVIYRDRLKADHLTAHVVSAVHAYPVPQYTKSGRRHPKAVAPSSYHLWCPYCIEWRVFHVAAIMGSDQILGPEQLRCPICTISEEDFHVKRFNHRLGSVDAKKLYKGIVTMQNVE